MIGNKARLLAYVSALGLMVIGCAASTSISPEATVERIDVEIIPPGEPAMIEEVANLTRVLQDQRKLLQGGEIFRGVHPKSHGCVDATFTVLQYIDSAYQVGLFAYPATYAAKIRYSNASVLKLADLRGGNGSRGMAIKVLGVNGPIMLADGDARNQDFLMINTPEFAFANVRDYLRLSRVLNADSFGADPARYFDPLKLLGLGLLEASLELKPLVGNEPDIVKDMWSFYDKSDAFKGFTIEDLEGTKLSAAIIGNIKSQTVRNPLEVQYFSAAPFRFGPDHVMKFTVVPLDGVVPQDDFLDPDSQEDDYLAVALKNSMTQGKTIHLSFKIQLVGASQLAGREQDMIENAAIAWSEDEFPFVKVAEIVIDPNKQNNEAFVDACMSERFTPWHGLAAHEPLGGINRMRKPVYCESGEFRPEGGDPDQVLCLAAQ